MFFFSFFFEVILFFIYLSGPKTVLDGGSKKKFGEVQKRRRKKLNLFWRVGGEKFVLGGTTNERPGTDHVTSGPRRGLEKNVPDGAHTQTDRHGDSMTESTRWGSFSEK